MSFGISNDLDIVTSNVSKANNEIEKTQEVITQLNDLVKTVSKDLETAQKGIIQLNESVSKDLEKAQKDIIQLNESVTTVKNNLTNTDKVINTVLNNIE